MHLFVRKNDLSRPLRLSKERLFGHLWTPYVNGLPIETSHRGFNWEDGYFFVGFDKNYDKANWSEDKIVGQNLIEVFPIDNNQYICVTTRTVDALAIDRVALYRLTILVAESQKSSIKENDKWLSVAEFKKRHEKGLNTDYASLMRISQSEVNTLDLRTEDPANDLYPV